MRAYYTHTHTTADDSALGAVRIIVFVFHWYIVAIPANIVINSYFVISFRPFYYASKITGGGGGFFFILY